MPDVFTQAKHSAVMSRIGARGSREAGARRLHRCQNPNSAVVRPDCSTMDEFLADADLAHRFPGGVGFALEVKLDRLLQIGHRFVARVSEARNVDVEALGHKELLLAVNTVVDPFHVRTVSSRPAQRNHA
jgi:hypothetical protein